jgi:acyl-CoA thioesterase I
VFTLHTFGDSILDCGHYNPYNVHPGQLLVANDGRFPEFHGRDLQAHGPARLEHRAQDGATLDSLPRQARGVRRTGPAAAILTVGGNDLIRGLIRDPGPGIVAWKRDLNTVVGALPIRPVFLGNVYDPTFGDDARNFLGVEPARGRRNHRALNAAIADVARRYGALVDLHAHFLTGDPSWFTHTIEPSLRGASEVRRAFLPHVLQVQHG